jgi:hypothetical protein
MSSGSFTTDWLGGLKAISSVGSLHKRVQLLGSFQAVTPFEVELVCS